MLPKVSYGVAFLAGLMLSVGVFAVSRARSASGPAWTDHSNPLRIQEPALLTKHELFSEDHTADVIAIEQVWGAYAFYNDSINGPGMASLFTPNGVDQHLWDDGEGKLIPDFGIVAPED